LFSTLSWHCPYCSFGSACSREYTKHLQIHIDGVQQCACGKLFETKALHKAHTKRTNCIYEEKTYAIEPDNNLIVQQPVVDTETVHILEQECEEEINENPRLNYEMDVWDDASLCFLTSLCADGNMSRKAAIEIYNKSKAVFFDPLVNYIENGVLSKLPWQQKKKVVSDLKDINRKLKSINSEHKLEKILECKGVTIKPIITEIDARTESVRKGDELVTVRNSINIATSDIVQKFELFFGSNNNYLKMKEYYRKVINSDTLKNFINGTFWKNTIIKYPTKNMLPFFLFYDEFVYGNQLSKKKGATSIAGFYTLFPTMPPELRSKINSILTVATIETKKIKENGFEKCLSPVIDAFDQMENEGVEIKTGVDTYETVYPILVQILGDNKGLNEILGLVGSFISKHHCRTCYEEIDIMRIQIRENPRKIRNEESHMKHLQNYNPSETGIKDDCCFNRLNIFKSFNNKVIDIHHDFLHGCCNFIICPILLNFIRSKILDLDRLNTLRSHFIAVSDGRNISKVEFTKDNLEKENLPLNAVEMMQFTVFLPLILDHIVENKESDDWKLLMLLIEALESVWLPEHDEVSLEKLDTCIQNLLQTYFVHIKPHFKHKLHNLVHIVSAIRSIGPTAHYSALRGEAKHQDVKKMINSSNSKVNVAVSVARKEGFKAASSSFDTCKPQEGIFYGKRIKFSALDRTVLGNTLLQHKFDLEKIFETNRIEYFGVSFRSSYAIYQNGQIYQIIKLFTDAKQHAVYCRLKNNFMYQNELRCFKQVTPYDTPPEKFCVISLDVLEYEPSILIDLPSGQRALKFFRKFERY
jgi:hypothetical protein